MANLLNTQAMKRRSGARECRDAVVAEAASGASTRRVAAYSGQRRRKQGSWSMDEGVVAPMARGQEPEGGIG